jgi:pyruvate dehydrogenase E2 component (dihydrolipoyllysine-residue acetyltransferase)
MRPTFSTRSSERWPVASEVKLPRLGQGMEAGTIVKWRKSEGEQVEKGEPLYELDTDKVTQEVEADFSGVLLKIAIAEGEVPVGKTIGVIGEQGEEFAIAEPEAAEQVSEKAEAKQPVRDGGGEGVREVPPAGHEEPAKATPARDGRVKASPLARRIARERGIDLATVRGTGPEGRVVAEDVERAEAAPAAAPAPVPVGEVERRELSSVRRTIAKRLTEAWTIPVFQLQASADMTRVNALVARLRGAEQHVTVTDILVKVSALALIEHREVNAEWTDDAILLHPSANVGIAVAAPQGLVVPVIRGAERLRLAEISAARADLVARAREAKLTRDDIEGGTFTISNLGMFAVESFTAVLNPPQAAIVAVGATEERVVAVDGEPAVRPMMTLVATFDHRAVDGAPAAGFLQTLKSYLEEPGLAL